jgi:hypothetical protein
MENNRLSKKLKEIQTSKNTINQLFHSVASINIKSRKINRIIRSK